MSVDPGPSQIPSAPLHAPDREEKRLQALLAHTREALALYARQMHPLYISSAGEQLPGSTPAEYGQLGTYVALLHPDDRQPGEDLLAALLQTPGASATTRQRVKHQDGTYRWVEAMFTNLLDDPEIAAVLVQLRDISDLKRLEERGGSDPGEQVQEGQSRSNQGRRRAP
jgi:PAS domain S-box-containing protein